MCARRQAAKACAKCHDHGPLVGRAQHVATARKRFNELLKYAHVCTRAVMRAVIRCHLDLRVHRVSDAHSKY